MSLRKKLMLIILVPSLVISLYAVLGVWHSQTKLKQLSSLSDLMVLIDRVSDVEKVFYPEGLLYLQFVEGNPHFDAHSRAEKEQNLKETFSSTDEAIAAFQQERAALDIEAYEPAMQETLRRVDSELEKLSSIRGFVADRSVDEDEWNQANAFYSNLGGIVRELIGTLVNESTDHRITRKILTFYKATEAFAASTSAKNLIDWAIEAKALPFGANAYFRQEHTREKESFRELLYYATEDFSRRIRQFLQAEPYQRGEAVIEDIISKGSQGGYLVQTKAEHKPTLDHIKSFERIVEDLRNDLNESVDGAITNAGHSRNVNILALVLSLGITLIISLLLSQFMIEKPLHELGSSMQQVASGDGDLTRVLNIRSRDEIGEVAGFFNTFLDQIRGIVVQMKGVTERVHSASNTLVLTSENMAGISSQLETETTGARSSSASINTSVHEISETATEINQNLNSVNVAVEQLSTSIGEIAHSCSDELRSAGQAKQEMDSARLVIGTLNQNAREIQSIVEIIHGIAAQTNLLALNATIEAASAGEAGKGFAVVANEVKELAHQSRDATEKITQQVSNIQNVANEISGKMNSIGDVIELLHGHSESIAAAAEEQSVTTSEISGSFSTVANAFDNQAHHIEELSVSIERLSQSLEGIENIAQTVRNESESSNKISITLNELQSENEGLLVRFKTS